MIKWSVDVEKVADEDYADYHAKSYQMLTETFHRISATQSDSSSKYLHVN